MKLRVISIFLTIALLLSACQQADPSQNKAQDPVPSSNLEATDSKESQTQKESSEQDEKSVQDQKGVYQKISAEEAKKMMDEQEVIIVDVRTQGEYDGGHIENALLIPNETIGSEPPEALSDKSAIILLYCRSGNRSSQAARKLLDMGYQNVYDFGSIADWSYGLVK